MPSVEITPCPICKSLSSYMYYMQPKDADDEKSKWYRCNCGVIWQGKLPQSLTSTDSMKKLYNEDYINSYLQGGDKYIRISQYPVRVYAPLIEELIYGRMILDVGFNTTFLMQAFQKRGWVAHGIECNAVTKKSERIFNGDFEYYEFPKDLKFNLIWMSHVLEHFRNPIRALEKARDMMKEDGVIFIATPDTDFVVTRTSSGFPHWKMREHYIMWNIESLSKELERIGFNVILQRRNYDQRFANWDDLHIIAQKKFY